MFLLDQCLELSPSIIMITHPTVLSCLHHMYCMLSLPFLAAYARSHFFFLRFIVPMHHAHHAQIDRYAIREGGLTTLEKYDEGFAVVSCALK